MTDSLENRIGIALKAAQYQMHHSDAREGLAYMHERVDALREFGNPWSNPYAYYQHHVEIVLFLRHIGFGEFDEEELRLMYNHIVDSVYRPEVVDDPKPRTQVALWKAEETALLTRLDDANRWVAYLSQHDPTKDPTLLLNLPEGVYLTQGGRDLAKDLHGIILTTDRIRAGEKFLSGLFEGKEGDLKYRADMAAEGLGVYEERERKKPTLFGLVLMVFEPWFRPPIFSMGDIIPAIAGDFALLKRRVEEKQAYRKADYLDTFPSVREKIRLLGYGRYIELVKSVVPGFMDSHDLVCFSTSFDENQYYVQRAAVEKEDAHVAYHLLQEVKALYAQAEKAFNRCATEIKELHPTVAQKWLDAQREIPGKLREASRAKEAWESEWRENYSGVRRCQQLRQESLNHPWMNNTHPVFNTAAYSAKLVGLSAQLEALHGGSFHPPTRLLTG